ncbi:hypothetical protein EJB05_19315 [Eragrostis curvula]|uniref:Uncharacterized protein n=1 Tax=Eragrostis curvula TaxID=38414 RepID=A0A5J9UWZ1_9POAL|nr:hypothetical protein EJB05_19315 [Eragrostis curvula]
MVRCSNGLLGLLNAGAHKDSVMERQQSTGYLGYVKSMSKEGWFQVKSTCLMTASTGCHQCMQLKANE